MSLIIQDVLTHGLITTHLCRTKRVGMLNVQFAKVFPNTVVGMLIESSSGRYELSDHTFGQLLFNM